MLDQDGTENSRESGKVLQLPLYIRKLAPKALDGWKQICIKAWSAHQVECWQPILKAKRALLQIYVIDKQGADKQKADGQAIDNCKMDKTKSDGPEIIWLPLSYTGGFEDVFPEVASSDRLPEAASTNGLPEAASSAKKCLINFAAYDNRFSRIQDRDLKLEMAVSRLLYPVELGKEARLRYEQLVKNRFRPAMLQLFGGKWNCYGTIPVRAGELFQLKKADQFLTRELLQKAVESGQPEFAALCMEVADCEILKEKNGTNGADTEWNRAVAELYSRKPELEPYCGLLTPYLIEADNRYHDSYDSSYRPAATDGRYLYYEKNWLKEITGQSGSDPILSRWYAHMLLHCLYLHPFQTVSRKEKSRLFHLACDITVEYITDQIFGPAEEDGWERQMVYDYLRRTEKVLTVQHVESCLELWCQKERQNQWKQQSQKIKPRADQLLSQLERWFTRDNHALWQQTKEQSEQSDSSYVAENAVLHTGMGKWMSEDAEEMSKQKIAEQWAQAGNGLMKAGNKAAGKRSYTAGQEQEEARLTKRQGYDYHAFLRQFMVLKEDRILDLDSYDPVYYTYGLNTYGNIPLIEALETKEVMRLEELVIVIDTSGSCSGKLVRFFLEETWSVFGQEENFFDRFEVRILQCDAVVQEDVKLTSLQEAEDYMKNLMIKGGGGTDFSAAFSYIKGLQKQGQLNHLKGILYFTDGFGTFPARPPGCRSAFIFLKSRFGQVEVPYWADKLLLELPEGADWEPEYTGGFQVNV